MAEEYLANQDERDLIRKALQRYIEQHNNIGVTEVHSRMLRVLYGDKAAQFESELSLSTLQRFLKNAKRTEDRVIYLYRQFLEQVAPPEGAETLSASLYQYFVNPLRGKPDAQLAQFAKTYRVHKKPFSQSGKKGKQIFFAGGSEYEASTSLTLKPNTMSGSFQVEERVYSSGLPGLGIEPRTSVSSRGGAFVPLSDTAVLVFIQTYLDIRLYILESADEEPGVLTGSLFEINLFPNATSIPPFKAGLPAHTVRLVPESEDDLDTDS